jgi:ADP-heptose:LPS heptosyltransferase
MAGPRRLPTTLLADLPNWVGDQMMAMPAVNRLVEGNRGGRTVLHTRPAMVRLLSEIFPSIPVVASPLKASPFWSARALRESGGRCRVGISLRNSARAKILVRLGAAWCVGSRGECAFVLLSKARAIPRDRHQVHDGDPILAALGLEGANPVWRPPLSAALVDEGARALRAAGVDRERAVAIAPSTARGERKRWPVERYGELAARLAARGYEPVVVIGPGEEQIHADLCSAAGREISVVGVDLGGRRIIKKVAGVPVLVGNDSGPLQTAARFGTAVVAIFGPTDPDRTGPLGSGHRVLAGGPDLRDPTRGVSVDEVEGAVLDLV